MRSNRLLLTFCFESSSILVSEEIINALDYPKHIQMLINEEQHMFLLRPCDIDDVSAIVVPPLTMGQFEISAKALLRRLRRIEGWDDTIPIAVRGEYIHGHNAIVFPLDTAQPVQLQRYGG